MTRSSTNRAAEWRTKARARKNGSKGLNLTVKPNIHSPMRPFFVIRNGDGLSQFSGVVKLSAIPKLTQIVFDSEAA